MASQKSTRAVKPSKNMSDTKTQACQWKYCDHECSWDTQCDNKYQFTNDGPKENDYKFCPGCGKPVALAGQSLMPTPLRPQFRASLVVRRSAASWRVLAMRLADESTAVLDNAHWEVKHGSGDLLTTIKAVREKYRLETQMPPTRNRTHGGK